MTTNSQQKPEHSTIEPDFGLARQYAVGENEQPVNTPLGEQGGEHSAGDCQQNALCKELPYQTAAACSERRPDGHLSCSNRCSCEQQVGHIRARDEQHETNRRHQDQKSGTHTLDHGVLERTDQNAPAHLLTGVEFFELDGNTRHIGPGVIQRGSGLQPADDPHPVRSALLQVIVGELQRQPEFGCYGRCGRKRNHDGITPTTVWPSPSSVSVLPRMPGSRANRRSQSRSLIMTAFCAPG